MEDSTDLRDLLIPVANAQTLDSVSQPTWGTIDVGNGATQVPTILLEADRQQVPVGETATFSVLVDTQGLQVNKITFFIDFDPDFFQIIDEDTVREGTQVNYTDSVFNQTSNTVAATGLIRVIAEVPNSGEFAIDNRSMFTFRLQAQQSGSSSVLIETEGSLRTLIERASAQTDINFTSNQIDISIADSTTDGNTPGLDNGDNTGTPIPTIDPNSSPITPNTSFNNDFQSIATGLLAFVLIIIGLSLRNTKDKNEKVD